MPGPHGRFQRFPPPPPGRAPLRLHTPEQKPMPGPHADFSAFRRPPAGRLARPAIDVPSVKTHRLATALIRVLDDDGKGVGEWAPHLDPDPLRQGLRAMMLTRAY